MQAEYNNDNKNNSKWTEMDSIDWEKPAVEGCHPHYRQRCAQEAWHIRTEPHKMNRDEGPLPSVYNPLIQQRHRCHKMLGTPGGPHSHMTPALLRAPQRQQCFLRFFFFLFPLPCPLISRHVDSVYLLLFIIIIIFPLHYVITTIVTFFLPLYAYKSHLAL